MLNGLLIQRSLLRQTVPVVDLLSVNGALPVVHDASLKAAFSQPLAGSASVYLTE